jgi:hypothetical protein
MKRLSIVVLAAVSLSRGFAQGGFEGQGRYVIRNVQSGLALDLRGNELIQNGERNVPTQVWEIRPTDPGVFLMTNEAERCSLEFDQDRNGSPVHCTNNHNPNQYWRFEGAGNGALIISRFRKPLDVPDGTNREGIRLQIYDRNGDSNQRFVFQRVAGGFGGVERGREGDRDRGREGERGGVGERGQYFDNRDQMWKIEGDGICFYRAAEFRGEAVCARSGENIDNIRAGGAFLSLKFFGRARDIAIFERPGFRGGSLRLSRDEPNLRRVRAEWGGSVSDAIGSFRVN